MEVLFIGIKNWIEHKTGGQHLLFMISTSWNDLDFVIVRYWTIVSCFCAKYMNFGFPLNKNVLHDIIYTC